MNNAGVNTSVQMDVCFPFSRVCHWECSGWVTWPLHVELSEVSLGRTPLTTSPLCVCGGGGVPLSLQPSQSLLLSLGCCGHLGGCKGCFVGGERGCDLSVCPLTCQRSETASLGESTASQMWRQKLRSVVSLTASCLPASDDISMSLRNRGICSQGKANFQPSRSQCICGPFANTLCPKYLKTLA